jgi:hypothetical protein
VISIEKNPIIFSILYDGYMKAINNPLLKRKLSNMKIIFGNSFELIKNLNFDVLYFDPMNPNTNEKQKSKIKNNMQYIREIVNKNENDVLEEEKFLLNELKLINFKKFVLKRTLKYKFTNNNINNLFKYSLNEKNTIFDIITK